MTDMDHLLEDLTQPQREAVTHTEGPLLVLAAAGSGKTRVITRRIAYLVSCGVPAWSILALTFTNKAAGEMRERVHAMLNPEGEETRRTRGLTVSTFHALCARLLRRYAELAAHEGVHLGIKGDFTIYTSPDQLAAAKAAVLSLGLSTINWSPRSVLGAISNAKNDLLDAEAYAARAGDFSTKNLAKLYAAYQKRLRAANAVDFDDLLLLTARMLRDSKAVREECQRRWQYLLIDEYQDTNHAQLVIASMLAGDGPAGGGGPNICVVGDPDQCLMPGTPVRTPDGPRAVETLTDGDAVTSGSGWGATAPMPAERIMTRPYRGPVVRITTEDGDELTTTPNHILFAKLRAAADLHYVYLMWKRGVGYRLGTTRGVRASKDRVLLSGLQVRTNQEVADAVWVVRTATTPAEVRFYEHYFSVKYGIPTMVFFVRGRRMDMTQDWIDRLYADVDTDAGAERLMAELYLDLRYPHHRPGAVSRKASPEGQSWARRHVLFTVFGGPREHTLRPWHEHRVQLVTSDPGLRERATGRFPVRDGARGTWRIETSRKDYDSAKALASEIGELDGGMEIISRARLTRDKAFVFMPASHVHPGMVVPVCRGTEIVERVVSAVDWADHDGPVYDLSVPNTRNYVAGGIVVHNSIYSWRGADITNILEFEERYPKAAVITLGENFRSTAPILAAADALIRHNKKRKHKDLFTSREGGELVTAVLCRDERHEAQLVADWLRKHAVDEDGKGYAWREMAVFYRTNALSRVMEDALREAGIPYSIARGTAFFDREEIKHALAYLRVVANQADDVSLERVVNVPARGIGATSLGRVREIAEAAGLSLWDGLNQAEQVPGLSTRAVNAMKGFVELIDRWTGHGSFMGQDTTGSLAELVERVIRESGLEKMYKHQAETTKSEADAERLDNLSELVSSAAQFEAEYDPASDPFAFTAAGEGGEFGPELGELETPPLLGMLRGYLEKVSLVADADAVDPASGSVTLMTLHAAKGLEFPVVAMIGLEEGLLPHSRAHASEDDLEEERRLCFVGITRAMRHVQLTSAKYRTIRGMSERTIPSRFIEELPREHTLLSDQSDAWDEAGGEFDDDFGAGRGRAGGGYSRTAGGPRDGAAGGAPVGGHLAKARQELPVGCKVRHPQFGVGEVLGLDGGASVRAKIRFKDVGVKTLILEYARLQRLS